MFPSAVNPQLIQPICDLLQSVTQDPVLDEYRRRIWARLPVNGCANVNNNDQRIVVNIEKSILEAVERIAVLAESSNPIAGFIGRCNITFAQGAQVANEIAAWYAFCNWGASYDRYYLDTLCNRNAPNSQNYLLWEWEHWLIEQANGGPVAIPQGQPPLQLEHILPAAWNETIINSGQTFGQWGFRDEAHFQREVLDRIGNKALLWERCNESVGNQHPNLKAIHYNGNLCNHFPNANALKQIEKLGNDLTALGAGPSQIFKCYIELRCAELATFAYWRLC